MTSLKSGFFAKRLLESHFWGQLGTQSYLNDPKMLV